MTIFERQIGAFETSPALKVQEEEEEKKERFCFDKALSGVK